MLKRLTQAEAERTWNRARRAVFWAKLQANLGKRDLTLLDFNEVSHRLKLHNAVYRGTQFIPLKQIIGSMGRYNDFTRTFLPMGTSLGERWRGVAAATLDPGGQGLPPIEAYKAGNWYFVKDGNHRCSVARMLGQRVIEAYVWEFTDEMPESHSVAELEQVLIDAERRDFLEQTNLEALRPNHGIQFSLPGGYFDLLSQIANYQEVLHWIDGNEIPYEEAVCAWYDMIYESSMQLIQDSGVLTLFPERTPADFFIWIIKYRDKLHDRYGKEVMVSEATEAYKHRHPRTFFGRMRQLFVALYHTLRYH